LRELLDGVQASGHLSLGRKLHGYPERDRKIDAVTEYFVAGDKVKVVRTDAVKAQPDSKQLGVYIYNGNTTYTAASSPGAAKLHLLERRHQDAGRERGQFGASRAYVHCQLSLKDFYIPELLSSPDYRFRMNEVDELTASAAGPKYRIHFTVAAISEEGVHPGWMVVDPQRHWAVEEFEHRSEVPDFSSTTSGTVKYSASSEGMPRPLSLLFVNLSKFTVPSKKKGEAAEPRVQEMSDTYVFDRYDFRKPPDSEFSLASIGLGSGELAPGTKSNKLSYTLGLCSVASLIVAVAIAYYRRRAATAQRLGARA